MISTCVHCKKQFEWGGVVAFTAIVQCCHCNQIGEYNPEGVPQVLKSKPLQVAKKWVVRIGLEAYLIHKSLITTDYPKATRFDTFKEATSEADAWAYNFNSQTASVHIYRVEQ